MLKLIRLNLPVHNHVQKWQIFLFSRWTDNIFSIQEWVKRKFPSIDQVGTKIGNCFSK